MLPKYLLPALALGLMSTVSQAQQPPGFFESMDLDKDGYLSVNELMQSKRPELLRMDADKDGRVSQAEMPRGVTSGGPNPKKESTAPQGLVAHFKAQDTDGDGTLSREEFSRGFSGTEDQFEKLDRNKDGALALDELKPKAPTATKPPPPK